MENNGDYERGKRDGELESLRIATTENTKDIKLLNRAVFLLYGAIALMQFIIPIMESRLQ